MSVIKKVSLMLKCSQYVYKNIQCIWKRLCYWYKLCIFLVFLITSFASMLSSHMDMNNSLFIIKSNCLFMNNSLQNHSKCVAYTCCLQVTSLSPVLWNYADFKYTNISFLGYCLVQYIENKIMQMNYGA